MSSLVLADVQRRALAAHCLPDSALWSGPLSEGWNARDAITPADGHARMRGRYGGGSRLDGAREKKCGEKCYGMLHQVKWHYEM